MFHLSDQQSEPEPRDLVIDAGDFQLTPPPIGDVHRPLNPLDGLLIAVDWACHSSQSDAGSRSAQSEDSSGWPL